METQQSMDIIIKALSCIANYSATIEAANKAYTASIITASVTGVVGISSCVINLFISKSILKKDYNKMYKEIITTEKIKSLNLLRETIAQFLAQTYFILSVRSMEITKAKTLFNKDIIKDLSKSVNLIKLQVKIDNEQSRIFIKLLDELEGLAWEFTCEDNITENLFDDYEITRNQLEEMSIKLIQTEWGIIENEVKHTN